MAKAIINGNEIFGNVHLGEDGDVANPNIADVYDPTQTYNTGDRRIYNDVLYVCNDNNVTGAWDSTKWDSATIDEIISALTAADIPYSASVSVADKLDNVPTFDTLTTSDNNKLLGVSVSGSDISVGAVDLFSSSSVSISSGVEMTDVQLYRYGRVVYFRAGITVTSPSSWQTVATIPIGYRPAKSVYGVMDKTANMTGMLTAHIDVEPNGNVRLANALPDANSAYRFAMTWIV